MTSNIKYHQKVRITKNIQVELTGYKRTYSSTLTLKQHSTFGDVGIVSNMEIKFIPTTRSVKLYD